MGSTRRAVSGSVFGVTASSGLTAACPPFAVSIGVNLWQLGISSTNCHRVRREIKSRRLNDESFRKEEEEYKAKKRHHPLVDVALGVTLKAACMTATLGIIGFDNIGDAFVAKFADKITDAASAAASAVHALPVYSHMPLHVHVPEHTNVSIPDPMSMFQDANGSDILCPNMNEMDLSSADQPEVPATAYLGHNHDTDFTSPATNNPFAAESSVSGAEKLEVGHLTTEVPGSMAEQSEIEAPTSSAEQLKIDHPHLYGADNARSNALCLGQQIGEKISQHVVDDSVKIGMEAKWDDLKDLHDNWNLSIAKILGLVVLIALVNEIFQPIPHASSIVAEKAIDAWNGGQLSRMAGKAIDAWNDGQLSYVTARLAHIAGRL
ncbi:hypothetical protein GCG54_00009012 [Colletotrichum gloeosporioides]|uniref:Uncharacterized protein n=1 Tax=Colletotrichum gloeosporioides TaxID=474922 RepID=A0A8H8WND0_COLGL|nr:uncharacterized protein GCG54_00009012 [Colletotrichum gloeosporioides]KAF3797046.1 hypothetical protein GCG54_00009012 [Colletotrichum gloeosporioides]